MLFVHTEKLVDVNTSNACNKLTKFSNETSGFVNNLLVFCLANFLSAHCVHHLSILNLHFMNLDNNNLPINKNLQ